MAMNDRSAFSEKNSFAFPFSIFHFKFPSLKLFTGLMILFSLSSCWPTSVSFRDSSMPEEWKSFYVAPLELTAPTAPSNYNAVTTENLRTGIQNNTRLRLAQAVDSAEVQISGIITNYNTSPVAIQQGDNAAVTRLTVSASFTIITPTKGLEKMTMTSTRFADFDSSLNLQDVEAQLIETINQQIEQDVINQLLSNW
jgi:hypothetical protein